MPNDDVALQQNLKAYELVHKLQVLFKQRAAAKAMLANYDLNDNPAYMSKMKFSKRSVKAAGTAENALNNLDKDIGKLLQQLNKLSVVKNNPDLRLNLPELATGEKQADDMLRHLSEDLQNNAGQQLQPPNKTIASTAIQMALLKTANTIQNDLHAQMQLSMQCRDERKKAREDFIQARKEYKQAYNQYKSISKLSRIGSYFPAGNDSKSAEIAALRRQLNVKRKTLETKIEALGAASANVKKQFENYKGLRKAYAQLLKKLPEHERNILRAHNQAHKAELSRLSIEGKGDNTVVGHFQAELTRYKTSMDSYCSSMNSARTSVAGVSTQLTVQQTQYNAMPRGEEGVYARLEMRESGSSAQHTSASLMARSPAADVVAATAVRSDGLPPGGAQGYRASPAAQPVQRWAAHAPFSQPDAAQSMVRTAPGGPVSSNDLAFGLPRVQLATTSSPAVALANRGVGGLLAVQQTPQHMSPPVAVVGKAVELPPPTADLSRLAQPALSSTNASHLVSTNRRPDATEQYRSLPVGGDNGVPVHATAGGQQPSLGQSGVPVGVVSANAGQRLLVGQPPLPPPTQALATNAGLVAQPGGGDPRSDDGNDGEISTRIQSLY